MTKSCWIRRIYGAMAHVNNKFERKTKTEFSFPRRLNFLPLADGSRSFHDCEMLLLRDC